MKKVKFQKKKHLGFHILPGLHIYYGIDWMVENPPRPNIFEVSFLFLKWELSISFHNRSE